MSAQIIGYEAPARYFCRACVPDAVVEADSYDVHEGDDDSGVPLACDVCGKALAPCQHTWGSWWTMLNPERERRYCTQPGCEEFEEREAVRS